MDRDSAPTTATQADPGSSRTISRRGVMRATAIGVGATAAGGVGTKFAGSPVGEASAVDWKAAGVYALAGPIGLLAYGSTLLGPDEEQVSDALEWETHVSEFTRYREENLSLDQTLASLERDVQLVENKAREEAIFRIYEQAVDSGDESTATDAAETAINEAYSVVQAGILDSFTIRAQRFQSVADMFLSRSDVDTLGTGPFFRVNDNAYTDSQVLPSDGNTVSTSTQTLYDGTSKDVTHFTQKWVDGSKPHYYTEISPVKSSTADTEAEPIWEIWMKDPDEADYDTVGDPPDVSVSEVPVLRRQPWRDLYTSLDSKRDTLINEVPDMVDSYFTPAQDGNLDLNSALGPAYLANTASTAEDFEEAAMAMRSLGYPISDQSVVFSFDETPEDEFDGRLAWTAHNGNTLPVGETITPENVVGSIFAAANDTPEGADQSGGTFEITVPFTIVEASDGATEITFEDRSLASTETTAEEVETIFRENYDANQKATEVVYETATDSGGGGAGGGFFEGDGPSTRVLAIGAAGIGIVYALFGSEGS